MCILKIEIKPPRPLTRLASKKPKKSRKKFQTKLKSKDELEKFEVLLIFFFNNTDISIECFGKKKTFFFQDSQ